MLLIIQLLSFAYKTKRTKSSTLEFSPTFPKVAKFLKSIILARKIGQALKKKTHVTFNNLGEHFTISVGNSGISRTIGRVARVRRVRDNFTSSNRCFVALRKRSF